MSRFGSILVQIIVIIRIMLLYITFDYDDLKMENTIKLVNLISCPCLFYQLNEKSRMCVFCMKISLLLVRIILLRIGNEVYSDNFNVD